MKAWGSKKIFRREELPPVEPWQVGQFSGASIQRPHFVVPEPLPVTIAAEEVSSAPVVASMVDDDGLEADVPMVPMIAEAELDQIKQAARDTAYAEGFTQGETAGKASGLTSGQADGYQAGFAAGHEAGQVAVQAEIARLSAIGEQLATLLTQYESALATPILEIALAVAQQLTRRAYAGDASIILNVIREAIASQPELQGALRIQLHPDDLALVQPLIESDPAAKQWKFEAAGDVDLGGCKLASSSVEVDLTLGTRWQRIAAALGSESTWQADDDGR